MFGWFLSIYSELSANTERHAKRRNRIALWFADGRRANDDEAMHSSLLEVASWSASRPGAVVLRESSSITEREHRRGYHFLHLVKNTAAWSLDRKLKEKLKETWWIKNNEPIHSAIRWTTSEIERHEGEYEPLLFSISPRKRAWKNKRKTQKTWKRDWNLAKLKNECR